MLDSLNKQITRGFHCCPVKSLRKLSKFNAFNKEGAEDGLNDLNSRRLDAGSIARSRTHEPGTDRFCSDHSVSFSQRISAMCSTLRWRSPRSAAFMLGTVFSHGLCSVDPSRESPRYRSKLGRASAKTGPGKQRQTQIDSCRIQSIDRRIEIQSQVCFRIQGPSGSNQALREIGVDSPVANLVGVGERGPGDA